MTGRQFLQIYEKTNKTWCLKRKTKPFGEIISQADPSTADPIPSQQKSEGHIFKKISRLIPSCTFFC
ncbi:hypothetical protein V6Z12_A01G175200 [Gossypium hirsutum]